MLRLRDAGCLDLDQSGRGGFSSSAAASDFCTDDSPRDHSRNLGAADADVGELSLMSDSCS
jgi:hypothetical protein